VKIDFPAFGWERVEGGGAAGRTKRRVLDGTLLRILEVSPSWDEPDWCTRAHIGYVTSGRLSLEFAAQRAMGVSRGQCFWIPAGCAHKAHSRSLTRIFMVG
jgi:hypothetical protein